jgi:N-acetylmuramoyl-L-alanine amidase-like protein
MYIERNAYNKAQHIPYDPTEACGYQPRPLGRLSIRAIIDHTTNGKIGTSLHQEANYILNSREISSHYLIGKQGQIIEFLDPVKYIAYHAGCVRSIAFSNLFSIGVEMHNTPLEGDCTTLQLLALDWLVRDLIQRFSIKKEYIETHRAVAIYCKGHPLAGKSGRKIDPSGFPDDKFYAWRDRLYATDYKPVPVIIPPIEHFIEYKVISTVINIRQSPEVRDDNIAGKLYKDDTFLSIAQKVDKQGKYIKGKNTWAHVTKGISRGKDISGLGFVHTSNLIIVG